MSFFCYVYYRVADVHAVDAWVEARRLTELVSGQNEVSARLMKKVDDPLMWMEVYEHIREPDAFLLSLQACLEEVELEHRLQAGNRRQIELFQCA